MGRKKLPPGEKRIRKSIYFDQPMLAAIEHWERTYYPNHDLSSIVRVAVQIGLEALARDPAPLGKLPMRPDTSMSTTQYEAGVAGKVDGDPSKDALEEARKRGPNTAPPPKALVVKDTPETRAATEAELQRARRKSGRPERRR